jgi:hypothetical protein
MTHGKAKVESGVLLVERWIIAALRHRRFFSIEELNQAVRELRDRINQGHSASAKDHERRSSLRWTSPH